ncbi:aminotransferase class I/II-fold pyridoxal phosphate-dependent enzyme [Alphaproteobacteria bacterium]|nr:aminotransferase class I/II-fold pyridoxal phosphate-dependent enzyme [Alphaproteobacteria bacterium]
MKSTTSKRSNIFPFLAIDMLTRANNLKSQGKDIIHMDVGEPGFKTPAHILKYAKAIIKEKKIGYTESIGMPDLRNKISGHYKYWYDEEVNSQNIAVTAGASGAFVLILLAIFDPGDTVAIMTPYYPAYVNALKALNIKIIYLEGDSKTSYQPTVDKLENIKQNINGVIMASPANPTGSSIKADDLKKIANWSKNNKVTIISDEIYHGVEYGKYSETILKYNKDAIVINSFSKYFSMTGWRLGWLVAPKNIISTIEKLSMSLFLCPPTFSQLIAIKAFDDYNILNKNVLTYKKNRDVLTNSFEDMGFFKYAPPDGAFYLYIDVSNITDDSTDFAIKLLKEAGVSSTPGKDFDYNLGNKFIRFSYAGEHKEIVEGAKRIISWIKTKN